MISLKLRDFRGCTRAEITCGPIALVAGKNAAGKSSLAQAVGAVLCGNVLPFPGLAKNTAGMLVAAGRNAASVEIRSETGISRMDWPQCQAASQGKPPHASEWAAGLNSVALLPAKDRAGVLGTYLHADPTREDLVQALGDVELEGEQIVAAVWKLIEDQGWDAAHSLRKERGAELKGRWRQVTGANWGSRIAAAWRPADWVELDLDDETTEEYLLGELESLRPAHDKAVAAAAIAGAERERLGHEATQIEDRKDALQAAEAQEEALSADLTAAEAARAALPPAGSEAAMPCPHCGGAVVLRRVNVAESRLEKAPEQVPADELKQRRMAIADAEGLVGRLNGQLAEQNRAVERVRNLLHIALDARARLERMSEAGPNGANRGADDVAAAKTALETAERRLRAFHQMTAADEVRDKVNTNDAVLGILAPDGLRAEKLGRVLEVFNSSQLAPLCEAAGWKPGAVDPAMALTYGGRPYALLSTSEQYRVRAVLQLTMAKLDGSDMVVLDAADVLDGPTRSGLFQMLEEAGLPALVCMTLSRREQVPDLAAAGLGASYWIEDGIAQPLRQTAEAVA